MAFSWEDPVDLVTDLYMAGQSCVLCVQANHMVCSHRDACTCTDNLSPTSSIAGLQAQMWAETVRTRSHQNLMLFPRVLALAERAWHRPSWEMMTGSNKQKAREKDWSRFATLLGKKELKRLDKLDIHYRLPPPGVM